jgi:molybdopterin-containing oxidoreductase family iron-sulfur binding subunit
MGRSSETYASLHRLLEERRGRDLWRGLEQLADTDEFRRFLAAEFPAVAEIPNDVSRRGFLRLMGASMMLAGLSGCGEPPPDIVPYIKQPENMIPGVPRFYATAVTFEGYAQPILGETHMGRPTKLEGNPQHPASLGATDAFTQAAVLQLYDPDRSQNPTYMGRPTGWAQAETAIVRLREQGRSGGGLRLLTGNITSSTLLRQIERLTGDVPGARWHAFEAIGQGRRPEATRRAFGRPLDAQLRLDRAACVVSLDDDFLGPGAAQVFNARSWSRRRVAAQNADGRSRLHVAECTPSLTGAVATTRVSAGPVAVGRLAFALARELGIDAPEPPAESIAAHQAWIVDAAKELQDAAGQGLVTVGPHQPADVQAVGFLINEHLGNVGKTIIFTEPVAATPPDGERSLQVLVDDMKAGRVQTLVVLDANPVHAAPRDLAFAQAMESVPLRIHAGLHYDETAAHSHWHLPLAHVLESWSDARAVEGTATVIQPLVRPLYDVRSPHEIMALLTGDLGLSGRDAVQDTWRAAWGVDGNGFESRWKQVLHDGLIADTAAQPVDVTVRASGLELPPSPQENSLEVVLRPDPTIWDGRFANVGWLQELAKPLTKTTWDNVVAVSPALAHGLGVGTGDHVEIAGGGSAVSGPAWILPGQPERTVTVFLGYGRPRAGRVGDGHGFDAYPLVTAASPLYLPAADIRRGQGRTDIATTQYHASMEGADFVRVVARAEAGRPIESDESSPTLYSGWNYSDPSWGMAIDLDTCIGCNACVLACQAENNIAVVGKDQVAMGREMQWIRIDRYYEGPAENPRAHFQPVPCMHCEQAPCEMGCPVGATLHSADGINQMVYNRCIGTRTCSSYCPYKVRRFNWYDYTGEASASVQAQFNPDVTVRARGVMEKCTYCVQRISAARITAKKEQRSIRDGEVVTACQAVCPTQAIVFGNIKDPDSAVSRAKRSPRNYTLLKELNTWPRTTYLAEIDDGSGGGDDD